MLYSDFLALLALTILIYPSKLRLFMLRKSKTHLSKINIITIGYKKQKVFTLEHLLANLKIKYYEKITMQM